LRSGRVVLAQSGEHGGLLVRQLRAVPRRGCAAFPPLRERLRAARLLLSYGL
jgi:hypothetical protein